jgi:hypothetical protein
MTRGMVAAVWDNRKTLSNRSHAEENGMARKLLVLAGEHWR